MTGGFQVWLRDVADPRESLRSETVETEFGNAEVVMPAGLSPAQAEMTGEWLACTHVAEVRP